MGKDSNASDYEDNSEYTQLISESVVFIIIGVMSFTSSVVACIVMHKTRKIPFAAKFLSQGLLCFDCLYVVTVVIKRLTSNAMVSLQFQVMSVCMMQLTYVTVGMMSVERVILFNWPEVYMKRCTHRMIQVLSYSIWIGVSLLSYFVRYGVCFLTLRSYKVFNEPGYCNKIITIYYIAIVISVLIVSSISYWKIFSIIRSKSDVGKEKVSLRSAFTLLRKYKSTSLVLVYIIVVTMTSIAYGITVSIIRFLSTDMRVTRLSLDTIAIVNCMLDPYLYAFWFKESKMECFKLMALFNSRYRQRAEKLRVEIYDIVTVEVNKKSCRVHPLKQAHSQTITSLDHSFR